MTNWILIQCSSCGVDNYIDDGSPGACITSYQDSERDRFECHSCGKLTWMEADYIAARFNGLTKEEIAEEMDNMTTTKGQKGTS